MINKIGYTLYYGLWAMVLLLFLAYFSNDYYMPWGLFLPFVFVFTILLTVVLFCVLLVFYLNKSHNKPTLKKHFKLCSLPLIVLIPFVVLYFIPNKLENEEQTIDFSHINYACECAQFLDVAYLKTYDFDSDTIESLCVYIEPANETKEISSDDYYRKTVRLTGKFYESKGFPKDYYPGSQHPDKARVFRYTDYTIVEK